jgi:uncharacterized membrane protein YkvA (DUF1232 family)
VAPIVALLVSVAMAWLALVVVLLLARPRGMELREAALFGPDLVRLVRSLARDPAAGARWRLLALLGYLILPVDLVPDVVPLLGYADDAILVGLVLRSVVRRAGEEVVVRNWSGGEAGLSVVLGLAGVSPPDRR